jgi:excisionase family DNA binding protein
MVNAADGRNLGELLLGKMASLEKVVFDKLANLEKKYDEHLKLVVAEWISIEKAALICDCSYDHIHRAVVSGELPAADIGNGSRKATYRIHRPDLNRWMERKKGGKPSPPGSDRKERLKRYMPDLVS